MIPNIDVRKVTSGQERTECGKEISVLAVEAIYAHKSSAAGASGCSDLMMATSVVAVRNP